MEDVLEGVKEGHAVLITRPWGGREIKKVDRITPTGLIKVGTDYFYKNGYLRGSETYSTTRAVPCTDEHRAELKKERLIREMRAMDLMVILMPLPMKDVQDLHSRFLEANKRASKVKTK